MSNRPGTSPLSGPPDLYRALREGAPPKEIVHILRGKTPAVDPVPFHILTDPVECDTRDWGGMSPLYAGKPIIRGTTSSTSVDLYGTRMSPRALDQMLLSARDNLTAFRNHQYRVPEDLLGSCISATQEARRGQDGKDYVDLDVATLVVSPDVAPEAMRCYAAIGEGVKLGQSIGAYILEWEWQNEDGTPYDWSQEEDDDEWARFFGPSDPSAVMTALDVLLIEYSLVGMPANRRSWVNEASRALRRAGILPTPDARQRELRKRAGRRPLVIDLAARAVKEEKAMTPKEGPDERTRDEATAAPSPADERAVPGSDPATDAAAEGATAHSGAGGSVGQEAAGDTEVTAPAVQRVAGEDGVDDEGEAPADTLPTDAELDALEAEVLGAHAPATAAAPAGLADLGLDLGIYEADDEDLDPEAAILRIEREMSGEQGPSADEIAADALLVRAQTIQRGGKSISKATAGQLSQAHGILAHLLELSCCSAEGCEGHTAEETGDDAERAAPATATPIDATTATPASLAALKAERAALEATLREMKSQADLFTRTLEDAKKVGLGRPTQRAVRTSARRVLTPEEMLGMSDDEILDELEP